MRRASLFALLLLASVRAASADEVRVGAADGLVLDGRLDEPAWARATRLPAATVPVFAGAATTEKVDLAPEVRVLAAGGLLWIGVSTAEDPGLASGVVLQVVADGAKGAADAVHLAYVPQEVRSPRYVTRGPRGATRASYRLRGAADLSAVGATRLELTVPVADLGLPAPDVALRVAIQVQTRTPGTTSWVPPAAGFAGPERWLRLLPPEGGWGSADPIDAAALEEEDAQDAKRLAAWNRFQEASHGRLTAAPSETMVAEVRARLLAPLDEVLATRPDLAFGHLVKADVLAKVGLEEESREEARRALALVPGLREAAFSLHVEGLSTELSERGPKEHSDYVSAIDKAERRVREAVHPYEKDGASLGLGLLLFKRGEFESAIALLEPLAQRFPAHAPAVENLARARAFHEAWPAELQFRRQDATKRLPRARLETTRGPILLELFEDDAPNTVKNFVWLAQHRFYDGTAFHRVVPFFVAQGGDPLSRVLDPEGRPGALTGAGGPCYAIPTEPGTAPGQRRRRPFRGMVAMARSGRKDTEGSQFFLTTGTAAHLDGDYSVFGRIVEGQTEVAERLVQGDRIVKVEVTDLREGTEYRPTTTQGQPAPEPRPCGPGER